MSRASLVWAAEAANQMNMLAKVVKKDSITSAFTPFFIPEIGEGRSAKEGIEEFVFFDETKDFHPVEKAASMVNPAATPSIEDVLQSARAEAAQIIARAEKQTAIIQQTVLDR